MSLLSEKGKASSTEGAFRSRAVKEKDTAVCAEINFTHFTTWFKADALFQLPPGLSFVYLKSGP